MHRVSLKDSIAVRLLKYVFGAYCLIAIVVTALHMYSIYQTAERDLINDLGLHQVSVERSLAIQLWHFDFEQLEASLAGILASADVSGVSVLTAENEMVARVGLVPEGDLEQALLKIGSSGLDDASARAGKNLVSHSFSLKNTFESQGDDIGRVNLYASQGVIFERVDESFTHIILAALVKTLALWIIFIFFIRHFLGRPLERLVDKIQALAVIRSEQDASSPVQHADELELVEQSLEQAGTKLRATLDQLSQANKELSRGNRALLQAIEQNPIAVTITGVDGEIEYANSSSCRFSSREAASLLGDKLYAHRGWGLDARDSWKIWEEFKSMGHGRHEIQMVSDGTDSWIRISVSPVLGEGGQVRNYICLEEDITEQKQYETRLQMQTNEQKHLIKKLESAQNQLLQSEKMASLGQLAAGVAHEINNPVGYVNSNISTLQGYTEDLFSLLQLYMRSEQLIADQTVLSSIASQKQAMDFEFLHEDMENLISETREGMQRIQQIVLDLKNFSRVDESEWQVADLHQCLDSTLNIVWNELKYVATLNKAYGDIPQCRCIPRQLNQVFMNLLVNAAHAIQKKGEITVRTSCRDNEITISISDTGKGIPPENLKRLFEPFFTTKPVGKGTGLGLSVAYGIVKKHQGRIEVESELGVGTTFSVIVPVSTSDTAQTRSSGLSNAIDPLDA